MSFIKVLNFGYKICLKLYFIFIFYFYPFLFQLIGILFEHSFVFKTYLCDYPRLTIKIYSVIGLDLVKFYNIIGMCFVRE